MRYMSRQKINGFLVQGRVVQELMKNPRSMVRKFSGYLCTHSLCHHLHCMIQKILLFFFRCMLQMRSCQNIKLEKFCDKEFPWHHFLTTPVVTGRLHAVATPHKEAPARALQQLTLILTFAGSRVAVDRLARSSTSNDNSRPQGPEGSPRACPSVFCPIAGISP